MKILTDKYIRTEILDSSKVRNFCVKRDLFTKGDIEQYEAMFKLVNKYRGEIEILRRIAMTIVDHSCGEYIDECLPEIYGEAIAFLMERILEECGEFYFTFEQVEEDM